MEAGLMGKVGEELTIDRSQVSAGKRKVVCTKKENMNRRIEAPTWK